MKAERARLYWMNETSGKLRQAVTAYLEGGDLEPEDAASLRAYLRLWMASPLWQGATVRDLRERIPALTTWREFQRWFADADKLGIDPL